MRNLLGSMAFLAAVAIFGTGCGGPPPKVPRTDRALPPLAEVSDDAFAASVRDLLDSDPGSADRAARLSGVVSRQMTRAADRFLAGSHDRGLAAVQGALALVHTHEPTQPATFGPRGAAAMFAAAREYSARGDEGRARAMYDMILRTNAHA